MKIAEFSQKRKIYPAKNRKSINADRMEKRLYSLLVYSCIVLEYDEIVGGKFLCNFSHENEKPTK